MSKQVAYEAVYNQIIATMEKGDIPWKKSWTGAMPHNGVSGHKYAGVNFFLLSYSGFADPRWFTFNQVKQLGGNVKQGSKGHQIVFWKIFDTEDASGAKKSIPLLRYSTVFNFEQCENMKKIATIEDVVLVDAQSIVDGYVAGPKISYGFDAAFYSPGKDEVGMPSKTQFTNIEKFYSVLFHELGHSTGSEKRLNRKSLTDGGGFFGKSTLYSEEELVAELFSAFACNLAGIDNTIDNSAAYLKGWMKAFKDNPAMITNAASKAQKALNYVLGVV